jgi:hypothetical protein
MAQFLKPSNLNNVWASGGDRIYPGDTKYATGWQVEIPPRQYFNEIDYKQDQMLAHLNQHGIPVWDSETEYQADQSYVQGSTGTIYRCVLTHTNQDPDLDVSNTYWIIAFASAGDFYTATESDARYARISNNGSEYDSATFRTNLNVYSKAETYTKVEVDAKTTVASTAQSQAWASNTTLITPLRLAEAFKGANQSLSFNGFQKLPGGLILQWASVEVSVGSAIGSVATAVVTFPLAFTTLLSIQLTQDLGAVAEAGEMSYSISAKSNTSATATFVRVSGSNAGGEVVRATMFMVGI